MESSFVPLKLRGLETRRKLALEMIAYYGQGDLSDSELDSDWILPVGMEVPRAISAPKVTPLEFWSMELSSTMVQIAIEKTPPLLLPASTTSSIPPAEAKASAAIG